MLAFTKLRKRLVLVTGPTGSGKSTTLAAMIDLINKERSCHIVTVEDPIEFSYNHQKSVVHQRELHAHTHSFTEALKHLLRQDPNVVLVGEMRDLDTIRRPSLSRKRVTWFSPRCIRSIRRRTVDRIIDVFPPHQQQQDPYYACRRFERRYMPAAALRKDGKGRVAAREVMVVSPAISTIIREGKTHQIFNAIQTGGPLGMMTMDQAVQGLVKQGMVSEETAMAAMSGGKHII
jgi:twitching motility protein PilT